jgi:hypothetical protein
MQGRTSGVGARGEGGGHVRGDLLDGCATLVFVGRKLRKWMRLAWDYRSTSILYSTFLFTRLLWHLLAVSFAIGPQVSHG